MDKQLIEMMGIMMEQMNGVQSDVQSMKTEMKEMKTDIQGLKTEMKDVKTDIQGLKTEIKDMKADIQGLKTEMKEMKTDIQGLKTETKDIKTEMHERFDTVDTKLDGVGHQFEELSKNMVQLREDMKKELKYVTYKIHALDREVFMRTDSLH